MVCLQQCQINNVSEILFQSKIMQTKYPLVFNSCIKISHKDLYTLTMRYNLSDFGYNQYQHFKKMNEKSFSIGDHSFMTNRTASMGLISKQRFENVEKLSAILKDMQQNNKPAEPQQILDVIKKKIVSNYNNLYENYEANKNQIIKNIHKTETNQSNENITKLKFETVLKEKNAYDKLKLEIQVKQKKLKKILQLKDQMKSASTSVDNLKSILEEKLQTINALQNQRNLLEYEAAVLANMKKQRENIKLLIKERHQNMLSEQIQKKERAKNILNATHTKKILLARIEEKIKMQEDCEIPLSLAQELQVKLRLYEGKYAQQNIMKHENKMNEERAQIQKQLQQQQLELMRKTKAAKQKQDKRQFDVINNFYLLRQTEQERIKRLCRVQAITDIADGSLEEQKENLQAMKKNIQQQIFRINSENQSIKSQLEIIMTTIEDQHKNNKINVLDLQKELQEQQTQLRRIKTHANKKQNLINQWETILNLITNGKEIGSNLTENFRRLIRKYQTYTEHQCADMPTVSQTKQLKKSSIKAEVKNTKKLPQNSIQYVPTSLAGSEDI